MPNPHRNPDPLPRRALGWLRWRWKFFRLRVSAARATDASTAWAGDLEAFCLFVGYPRSGHSLVGALLDAHPDALVAHELNILRCVELGFTRAQMLHLLRRNAEAAARGGRRQGRYHYEVPGQWQGRFRRLRLIGDKSGGGAGHALQRRPRALDDLGAALQLPPRVIHVVRNPYDNITTFARKKGWPLEWGIDVYFGHCATSARLKTELPPSRFFEMRHEEFIARPARTLRALCGFLGLEPHEDYLAACTGLVYESPHQSRHDLPWPPALVARVAERMKYFPFLDGYDFTS